MKKHLDTAKKHLTKAHKKTVVPVVDLILGRTMSKKLMVLFIASWFLFKEYLTGEQWVTVASWYVGAQAVVDGCMAVMGNKTEDKKSNETIG